MNRRFLLLTLLLVFRMADPVTAQERSFSIPFQLTEYNNMSVQAVLNKKDTVNLMFHTAANAIALTEASVKKLQSIRFSGADSVKSWGGGGNTSRFSRENTIQIGELTWSNETIWEDMNSGQKTDGKFGIDLFAGKVIEIDFDKKIIVVSTSLPNKVRDYQRLALIFENDLMFVEAGCQVGDSLYKNRFLLHSGYSGAVLLDDKFAFGNRFDKQLKIVAEKELKDSFGHTIKTQRAVLPALRIGVEKLENVPVGFFEGSLGRQKMSVFGGDMLKRFNIIIDAERAHIYLKASSLKAAGVYGVAMLTRLARGRRSL